MLVSECRLVHCCVFRTCPDDMSLWHEIVHGSEVCVLQCTCLCVADCTVRVGKKVKDLWTVWRDLGVIQWFILLFCYIIILLNILNRINIIVIL